MAILDPTDRFFTSLPTFVTTPAASCPTKINFKISKNEGVLNIRNRIFRWCWDNKTAPILPGINGRVAMV